MTSTSRTIGPSSVRGPANRGDRLRSDIRMTTPSTEGRRLQQNAVQRIQQRGIENDDNLRPPTQHWGDLIKTDAERPADTFRIFSQNINGLAPRLGSLKMDQICESMKDIQADIVGLQETNVNWQNTSCLRMLNQAVKKGNTASKSATASASMSWDTADQPGGTCIWARDPWAHRTVTTLSDSPLGRWSGITLQGNQEQNNQTEPRAQCLIDLGKLVQTLTQSQHEVILLIDANEHLSDEGQSQTKFEIFLHKHNMTDILSHMHMSAGPPTHQRGRHRIDFIAMTPALVQGCRASGILPLASGHDSDHRGLYVDICSKVMFGGSTAKIQTPARRQLTTTNVQALTKYITCMREQFIAHRTKHKLQQLERAFQREGPTMANINAYEALDKWAGERMIHAERKCTRPHHQGHQWSPTLQEAAMRVRYWYLRIKQLSN